MKRKSNHSQYVVGNYQIGKKIGHGAYGTVYEAYKLSPREKYAVKILSFDDANYETVKYEAKICQQVFH
jgi:serine/threonine protein kinase